MVSIGILSVFIDKTEHYMATTFLFFCLKIFHSFAAFTRKTFSTREEKFHIDVISSIYHLASFIVKK